MIAEMLTGLAKANLAGAVAVLAVAALRRPMRGVAGPRAAYALWIAVPLAAAAVLAPHPAAGLISAQVIDAAEAFVATPAAAATPAGLKGPDLAFGLWLAGALAMLAWLGVQQWRFARAARDGVAGPAVVGVLRPRIVVPGDFEARFAADDRVLILAHEGAHLAAGDAAANALACTIRCLGWFNPFAHLAAHLMRIDQELACDAAVIDRFPQARRRYAELLLKTQIATQAPPLGCHWPAKAEHPLKERIAMLKSPLPGRAVRALGLALAAGLALGAGAAAWAAAPGTTSALPALAAKPSTPTKTLTVVDAASIAVADAAPATITHPVWIQKPTGADIARLYPPHAAEEKMEFSGSMLCGVDGGGRLQDCKVEGVRSADRITEPRDGDELKTAMLGLSKRFQMAPVSGDGVKTAGTRVRIPVVWKIAAQARGPEGSNADPKADAKPTVVRPLWLEKPTAADMARLYPAEHRDASADVTLTCRVGDDGRLSSCAVASAKASGPGVRGQETDMDFGTATLQLALIFKMAPQDRDGAKTAGGVISIPVRWMPPQPAKS